jgi:hypothetical protein
MLKTRKDFMHMFPDQPTPQEGQAPSDNTTSGGTPQPGFPSQKWQAWSSQTHGTPYGSPFAPVPPPRRGLRGWQIAVISVGGTVIVSCLLLLIISAAVAHSTTLTPQVDTASIIATATAMPQPEIATPTPYYMFPTAAPETQRPTPTAAPTWLTTQTFNGYQTEKSATFTTANQWRIVWSCNPDANYFGQYNVIANIYSVYPDGERSFDDIGVNEICTSSNMSGTSDSYFDPGTYLLDITTDGPFTFKIQEYQDGGSI